MEGVFSMCCATNRASPPGADATGIYNSSTRDICLSNGLCENVFHDTTTEAVESLYWRNSCSNESWEDGNCLNECMEEGASEMTPCDKEAGGNSTTWCCGHANTSCCESNPITLSPTLYRFSSTTSASASPFTVTVTSHPTSSQPAAQSSPVQTSSSGVSSGTKAAIALGVVLGAVVVLSLAGFFMLWMRIPKKPEYISPPVPLYKRHYQAKDIKHPQELSVYRAAHEMPVDQRPRGY
ncbi:hypothetical protein BGW36DRAFT_426180 [Talaromyces proteolyticus]|uniref:Mid2 domain-containing protein n=1 Tax=Talaromyces proteolyticus TaxID=1131652 RepID=A0AAD4Q1E8_9EURO|nr:uncharacterized protein BGW36DRAFT_426180 [Talaromyces proteolyticus]KAH8698473.1 hypothetical protein BGW36DRAFT_426180 [Talaromyces proteolyticus]